MRRCIQAKGRTIGLLEERKRAAVQRFITRGLDHEIGLMPSGIDWLGEIPQGWKVGRLKSIAAKIVDCVHATPVYRDNGKYPAIRTADVRPGRLLAESALRVDEEHYQRWTARMTPAGGDILYSREGGRFGVAAQVPEGMLLCISQRMMAFRIRADHNSTYVMWQMNCPHVYAQAAAGLIGGASPHVNIEQIKNFWLVLPPKAQQDQIASAVSLATARLDRAIVAARQEVALLKEYRSRLIADVVMGRLDIHHAAVLCDELGDQDLLDDAIGAVDFEDDREGLAQPIVEEVET